MPRAPTRLAHPHHDHLSLQPDSSSTLDELAKISLTDLVQANTAWQALAPTPFRDLLAAPDAGSEGD